MAKNRFKKLIGILLSASMLTTQCAVLPVAMAESGYSASLFADGMVYSKVDFAYVQTKYNLGDEFYAEVYGYTNEGELVKIEDYTVEGFDSYKEGEQSVTVSYGEYSETHIVIVSAVEGPTDGGITDKTVIAVALDYLQEEYAIGEAFNAVLLLKYSDETTGTTTDFTYEGFDSSKAGTQYVTITYGEFKRSVTVTVVEGEDDGSEDKGYVYFGNVRTEYSVGEDFYFELYVLADGGNYIQLEDTSSVKISGFDSNKAGTQTVTLYYEDYSETYTVIVVGETTETTIKQIKIADAIYEYAIGDEFYAELQVYYSDGTATKTTDFTYEGFDSSKAGTQNVKIIYGEYTLSVTVTIVESEEGGSDDTTGNVYFDNVKTEYNIGEDFYVEVYELTADGKYIQVEGGYKVSGFDNTKAGVQTVKIYYGDYVQTYTVTVVGDTAEKTIYKVEISDAQYEYTIGDEFYAELVVYYNDGTAEKVTEFYYEGFDSYTAGEQRVIITYGEYALSVTVTVSEKTDEGGSDTTDGNVCFKNVKTEYKVGEEFYVEVYELTADGKYVQIEGGYKVSGFDNTKAGVQTVKVYYGDYVQTYTVTVIGDTTEKTIYKVEISDAQYEYTIGDEFYAELVVYYNDGTAEKVTEFYYEGFDSYTAGEQKVIIYYDTFTLDLTVKVIEKTEEGGSEDNGSVYFKNVRTDYTVGEEFYIEVYALTSEGVYEQVKDGYTVKGFDTNTAGEQTVTVIYGDYSETYTVMVWEKSEGGDDGERTITNVELHKATYKYTIGEAFYAVLQVTYSDGTSELVYDFDYTGFSSTSEAIGEQRVVITYEGFELTVTVTVSEKTDDGGSDTKPSVYFANAKLEYVIGEEFYVEVYVLNDNGEYTVLTDGYTVEGFENQMEGYCFVTVIYNNYSEGFEVVVSKDEVKKEIQSISVASYRDKYIQGDTFEGEFEIVYTDGTKGRVAIESYNVEGFDTSSFGYIDVIIKYGDFSQTVKVLITNTLEDAYFENPKLVYQLGEDFYVELYVRADDGSFVKAEGGYKVSGFDSSKAGTQTVTVSYGEYSATYEVIVSDIVFDGYLEVENVKGKYFTGEEFYAEVYACTKDGTRERIYDYIVSGFDSNRIGMQIVTIYYGSASAQVYVSVEFNYEGAYAEFSYVQTEYYIGDAFNAIVDLCLADGSLRHMDFENYTVEGFDSSVAGTQKVTLVYKAEFDGCMFECTGTYLVTVTDPNVPTNTYWVDIISEKTEYALGENFEAEVWIYTNDNAMKAYDYEVIGFDSSKAGECEVTVIYGEYSQSFKVKVNNEAAIVPAVMYTVYAEALGDVTISPKGYRMVKHGSRMSYVITPDEGCKITEVLINGEPTVLTGNMLTLTITDNTTVQVMAEPKSYSVTAWTNGGGNIELPTKTVGHGGSCTLKFVPDENQIVADVIVNGVSVGAYDTYTIENITENKEIEVVFEKITELVKVTATAEAGGSITPATSVVNSGASVKFVATPDYGYKLAYVTVNGEIVSVSSNNIMLDGMTEDTAVVAVFEKNIYEVNAVETDGTSLSLIYGGESADSVNASYMDEVTLELTVNDGYELKGLYVNDTAIKAGLKNGKLVYTFAVTQDTYVVAKVIQVIDSEYKAKVAEAGLASSITAENAAEKKEVFTQLAAEYATLSEAEKNICTSEYATVLAALDRANAYIALKDADIIAKIAALPSADELTSENVDEYAQTIENVNNAYNKLTVLAKSLIDYSYQKKLSGLVETVEKLEKEKQSVIEYVYSLIGAIPEVADITEENLPEAYAKLMKAEYAYYALSSEDKAQVSDEMFAAMFVKHGRISNKIYEIYVDPFSREVLAVAEITANDDIATAESKRIAIYDLMDKYHSYADYIQELIMDSTVDRLNKLYESASITVSEKINDVAVDVSGDFKENMDLVISESKTENGEISEATGKAVYQAIDVKLYANEVEIQPSSKIRIKMEISKELAELGANAVYVAENGEVFDVQGDITEENGKYYMVFFIDHFSCFAIVYEGEIETENAISFDKTEIAAGETITATVDSSVDMTDCDLWIAGYAENGEMTFVQKADAASVSAVVAEGTDVIKAMLWTDDYKPVEYAEIN